MPNFVWKVWFISLFFCIGVVLLILLQKISSLQNTSENPLYIINKTQSIEEITAHVGKVNLTSTLTSKYYANLILIIFYPQAQEKENVTTLHNDSIWNATPDRWLLTSYFISQTEYEIETVLVSSPCSNSTDNSGPWSLVVVPWTGPCVYLCFLCVLIRKWPR